MKQFWNERFTEETFAYGKAPNEFLKENIHLLPKGNILFVAEGEGRNAVYAAKNGFEVTAFDLSSGGKKKADKLANDNDVKIDNKPTTYSSYLTYKEIEYFKIGELK